MGSHNGSNWTTHDPTLFSPYNTSNLRIAWFAIFFMHEKVKTVRNTNTEYEAFPVISLGKDIKPLSSL